MKNKFNSRIKQKLIVKKQMYTNPLEFFLDDKRDKNMNSYFFLVFSSTRNNKLQSHVDKYTYSKKSLWPILKILKKIAIEIDCLKNHVHSSL